MAQVPALAVAAVEGVTVTDDARHALIKCKTGEDDLVLALPVDLLPGIVSSASYAFGAAKRITGRNPSLKCALPVEFWQFDLTPDGQSLVLSFRMPGGMELSFRLKREWLADMRQGLDAIEARGAGQSSPGTPLH